MTEPTMRELFRRCCRLDWATCKDNGQALNADRLVVRIGSQQHPATVDAAVIDDLVLWLRSSGPGGRGASNGTINRYLSALRVMLQRAHRLGWIDALPLFPEGRQLREAEPRDLVLQTAWLEALLLELDEHDRLLTQFLAAQACRVGEALALSWDRVTDSHVQFVGTKGNKARRIPLFPAGAMALAQGVANCWERPFPGTYHTFHRHYKQAVSVVCSKLDLGEATQQQWCVHTLRHTRLSQLAQDGWPAPALQQLAGHSSLTVTARYVHASAANLDQLIRSGAAPVRA